MKSKPLPSQETLRFLFDYDPEEGLFYWKNPTHHRMKVGAVAGRTDPDRYSYIRFHNSRYYTHRLAWMYVYGEDPGELTIDHINNNPTDNRIANLRKVTQQQNTFNNSKAQGYYWNKRDKKFAAYIKLNQKMKNLGSFDCPLMARLAHLDAKKELHII